MPVPVVDVVVDVVVVSHNSAAFLPACLDSIAAQGPGVVGDVVVVDNASTDQSCAIVGTHTSVRWQSTGTNLGFGGAANRGVAATARSGRRYVAILNPDTTLEPGCLRVLCATLDQRTDLAAVGPLVLSLDGSVYPSARTFPSLADAAGHALLGHLTERNPFTRRYVGTGQPDWISGTAMVVRRADFEAVGGFDEAYFMYVEDVDLCWRWRRLGRRVDRVPEAVLHHAIGGSSEGAPFAMIVAHHRSLWRFAMRSTTGPRRLVLPLIAVGLVVRMASMVGRRTVHRGAPAAMHGRPAVGGARATSTHG